jgi:hypothetical protein
MLYNPWTKVRRLQHCLDIVEQSLDSTISRVSQLQRSKLLQSNTLFMLQRELSFAHAALRRKNKQLKQFKDTIILYKEYIKSNPPQTTR